MDFIKRFIAFMLSLFTAIFSSVSYGKFGAVTEPTPTQPQTVNDISGDSALADTVKYAAAARNVVQCAYTDPERSAYEMKNGNVSLVYSLSEGSGASAVLKTLEGKAYIQGTANSFDSFYTDLSGNTYTISESKDKGRVNTIRLGEYYYDCHIRDYGYSSGLFKLDRTYHIYADRLYRELTIMAAEATNQLDSFGSETRIPASTVDSLLIVDENGAHGTVDEIAPETVELVAFDIKDVGVLGFIIPSDNSTEKTTVTAENGCYVVRQFAAFESGTGINKFDETGGYQLNKVSVGCRIWTDETHSFEGVTEAARLERNPLTGVRVEGGNSNAEYLGYDALRGMYTLRVNGTGFNEAYAAPELQYKAPVTITCDDTDRDIYIRSYGTSGSLEAAAILDDTNTLVPVDVQVCKNFMGDVAEFFYSIIDYAYGDSIFPVSLKANETVSFTLLNLYQNWGKFPLKQLSSIEFHTSYYHLSTGVTESNCIAPYFVGDKDGWLLPDFRTRSGNMWASQPQFNSVGVLKFVTYDKGVLPTVEDRVLSEYTSCRIDSVGQTYADMTNNYVSDCGSYTYSLRHVEFPQTDENRTYYTVDISFNRNITFDNFRRDFDLFYFNGRFVDYNKAEYLGEDNQPKTLDVSKKAITPKYYPLGDNCPYFGFYDVKEKDRYRLDEYFGCNFALIVKDSEIIQGGEPSDVGLLFRRSADKDGKNTGVLTLNAKKLSFEPGDRITLNVVLLPWGIGTETDNGTALAVREDSALKPLRVVGVETGKAIYDDYVPRVYCENNTAKFTLSGGRNNNAVRVDGFTSMRCPSITVEENGVSHELELSSSNGYDGYTVHYNADGTYGFSFVFEVESPDNEYTFTVSQ